MIQAWIVIGILLLLLILSAYLLYEMYYIDDLKWKIRDLQNDLKIAEDLLELWVMMSERREE